MKKKILFVLFLTIIFCHLTIISATDNNTVSMDNQTSINTHLSNEISNKIDNNLSYTKNTSKENSLKSDLSYTTSKYYINSSVLNDGDGSKENPWKWITQSKFRSMNSSSVLYIANGNYSFDRITLTKDITITGEDTNTTIIKGSFKIYNSNIAIKNLTFNLNNFTSNGGIFDLEDSSITIDSSTFTNNTVLSGSGSVIYAHNTNILINNSVFINNSAAIGGVISICNGSGDCSIIENPSNITIINSLFNGNNATYEGGVIYDVYSNLYIKSSNFTNNRARSGGVIYSDDLELSIELSSFSNNNAKNLGGVIYTNQNTLSLTDNTFINNTAYTGGDLYSQYTTSSNLSKNNWSNNNSIAYNSTNYYVNPTIIITELNNTNTSVLPSRYDLRDYGYVTSVKNQGSDG